MRILGPVLPVDEMGRTIPIPEMPKRPPARKSDMDYWDLEKLFGKIPHQDITEHHWQAVSEFQLLKQLKDDRPRWIWRILHLIRKIFVSKPNGYS